MSDTTIDDLLDLIYGKWTTTSSDENSWGIETKTIGQAEAKSALYELMLSVIGEDEKLTHNVDTVEWIKTERNQLRQEMRNKLKELMK